MDARVRAVALLAVLLLPAARDRAQPVRAQAPGGASATASSGDDRPAPPRGFVVRTPSQGTGWVLYAPFPRGPATARGVMRAGLAALKTYFDGPVQVLSAGADARDQAVQAIVSASVHGRPVRAVATAVTGATADGGAFGIVLDRPDALRASFAGLSALLAHDMPVTAGSSGAGPAGADLAAPRDWTRQTGGDRSAAVDLPAGWQVKGCSEGAITIVGPHRELIQLGLIFFVSNFPGAQGMSGPYLAPVPAFSYFVDFTTRANLRQGLKLDNVPGRVIESRDTPAPMPNGRGAYLLQDIASNGQPARAFALVYTVPGLTAGWTLYTSYVSAPTEVFTREFADLLRIWSSWKVDDRVYRQQLQQTLQTMSATREILGQGVQRRMHAYDPLQESMELIIRGDDRLQNRTTGARADVPIEDADAVLRACRARGYDCRRVPFEDLVGP